MSSKKRIGKYIIIMNEVLGKGAFSIVYGGIIEGTNETVAIKVVAKSTIEQDEYTKNAFYSEIKIMKRLKSQNIIKFLDVHETKNNFYIVLERANGTLRMKLKELGSFDEKSTMICLIQILNGFGELVKNGVIHRDLKPENILLRDGVLKIADFGFAKHLENNSVLKTMVGTPAYMAPQILKEERYTYKCDIWSLGVITYELLVGENPWKLKTPNSFEGFRQEILSHKVVIPETVAVSQHMQDFIYGCICADEAKRLDWKQIFTHPIFGKKFVENFKEEGSTKITFILSNFRMNLNSKNLNLNKILSKLGDTLSKVDFFNLMRLTYRECPEEDIAIFFNYVEKGGLVSVADFKNLLKKYDISLTGNQLFGKGMDEEANSNWEKSEKVNPDNESLRLIERLKNSIEKGGLIISAIFADIKEKEVSQGIFNFIISKIDPSLDSKDCAFLFKGFDK
jgi:serine/threonine protein kinase